MRRTSAIPPRIPKAEETPLIRARELRSFSPSPPTHAPTETVALSGRTETRTVSLTRNVPVEWPLNDFTRLLKRDNRNTQRLDNSSGWCIFILSVWRFQRSSKTWNNRCPSTIVWITVVRITFFFLPTQNDFDYEFSLLQIDFDIYDFSLFRNNLAARPRKKF